MYSFCVVLLHFRGCWLPQSILLFIKRLFVNVYQSYPQSNIYWMAFAYLRETWQHTCSMLSLTDFLVDNVTALLRKPFKLRILRPSLTEVLRYCFNLPYFIFDSLEREHVRFTKDHNCWYIDFVVKCTLAKSSSSPTSISFKFESMTYTILKFEIRRHYLPRACDGNINKIYFKDTSPGTP